MSNRETNGFDRDEIAALRATLLGRADAVATAGSLGGAGLWAHILWRRRAGGLAVLPAIARAS